MNDILARRARRATVGIALSAALVAGIAPVTAIAAETSAPTGAAVSQTSAANGNSGARRQKMRPPQKKKRMQPCRKRSKTSRPQKTPQVPRKLRDSMMTTAIKEHIKQLRMEIMTAERREESCEDDLHRYQRRLESQEKQVQYFESEAKEAKAHIDEDIAKRNALLGDLEKAQAAYDDACKAYEEAKAAADKTTSPEIMKPAETTKPSSSVQPAETAQPASSPATGKDAPSSSTKQANTSSGKQTDTTAGKLANTGDAAPSAIALAAVAAAGLGITATATRRIRNSK